MRVRTSIVIAGLGLAVAACGPAPSPESGETAALRADVERTKAADVAIHADIEKLESDQQELRARFAEQEREIQALRDELSKSDAARKESERAPAAPRAGDPTGTIRGVIRACDNKVDIVIVSTGSRDGVNAGTELTVIRDGNSVATIVVDKVFPNYSSGSFKPGTPKTAIQPGDVFVGRARTDLPK